MGKAPFPSCVRCRTVIVLEADSLIASDIAEEIASLDGEAMVYRAGSVREAMTLLGGIDRLDLLLLSNRGVDFATEPDFAALARSARAVIVQSDREAPWAAGHPAARVTPTAFTADSLRRDLRAITVAGAPLFPRRSPG